MRPTSGGCSLTAPACTCSVPSAPSASSATLRTRRVRLPLPTGPTGRAVTAQGHPRARFKRAIEGRWVFHAELAAREAGNLTLAEALELLCLYAEAEPANYERAALRWHARFVTESGVRRNRRTAPPVASSSGP